MTEHELAVILNKMVSSAEKGNVYVQYHLFGIKYAHLIKELNLDIIRIVEGAGIKSSIATEVRKGMKLSEYVTIND